MLILRQADSITTPEVCQQVVQAIGEVMKNLDTVVAEVKEKINNIAQNCRIVPPIPETTLQAQSVVIHSNRIMPDNMAMKIVDEYRDRESRQLNLVLHNVPESQATQ